MHSLNIKKSISIILEFMSAFLKYDVQLSSMSIKYDYSLTYTKKIESEVSH